jgi:hypothetical protein
MNLPPAGRAPLLALGLLALVAGVAGGLVRMGVTTPAPAAGIAWHGALMTSAFFGTLISLERAVAIGRLWAYAAPAACAAGGAALLLGSPSIGFALLGFGSAVFALASVRIYLSQPALHTAVLALGAFALVAANVALAFAIPVELIVPAWIAFFALTIGAERLELSRLVRLPPWARVAFAALACTLLAAAVLAPAFPATQSGFGVVLLLCAVWLVRFDLATRTVRASGLTRYIAVCLLAGYAWLALAGGVLALTGGSAGSRELWDAALHAFFIGFVFSMVFGHAPVILPAVLRVAFPYAAALYIPLAALHATLVVRVIGDFAGSPALRSAGGLGGAAAIALFILTAAALVLGKSRETPRAPARSRGD